MPHDSDLSLSLFYFFRVIKMLDTQYDGDTDMLCGARRSGSLASISEQDGDDSMREASRAPRHNQK